MFTSDGLSAMFSSENSAGGAVRFLSDSQAVLSPAPEDRNVQFRLEVIEPTRWVYATPFQTERPSLLGVDRAGGIYYTNGDRLFRTTVGAAGPGVFLLNGLPSINASVLNADESAFFYLGAMGTRILGVYQIALTRDASGNVFASAPTMYYPVDALGTPDGLAIDVCGNLYTADRSTSVVWRIPANAVPGTAAGRPTIVANITSRQIGRPVFGVGPGFSPARLYWISIESAFMSPPGVFSVDVGVPGVRQ